MGADPHIPRATPPPVASGVRHSGFWLRWRHPRPRASTPYWIWLHVIALELAAMMLFTLALSLTPETQPFTGYSLRTLAQSATALIWLTIPLAFLYAIYAQPYRWFWLGLTGLAAVQTVIGFFGYLLPWGQISFWLAAQGHIFPESAGSALVMVSSAVLFTLICAHILQLARAGIGSPYRGLYSRLGVALLLVYGGYLAVEGWRGHAVLSALAEQYHTEPSPPSTAAPAPLSPSSEGDAPLLTPAHIVPEWHALPFYALLRAVPDKLGGVLAMLAALLIWPLSPWLDRGPPRPFWRRPGVRWVAPLILATLIALGWTGAQPAEGGALLAAQILGAAYFALFLIALPLASRQASRHASRNAGAAS